jgi:hypothetical protein
MVESQFFTEKVSTATEAFSAQSLKAGARLFHYPHPLPGPGGEPIETTVARLGPERPERMVAVVSATHGIEGHAGSAIQIASLAELQGRKLPEGLGLLFVHMINPWGCAWNRRENEDNVDIFRNLVYDRPPFHENPLYDQYEEGINPRAWTGPVREKADAIFDEMKATLGVSGAIGVIRRGQHRHPKGLTFHGTGPTWSAKVAQEIGREHFAGVPSVMAVDLHTGYGESGDAFVVPFNKPGSPKSDFLVEHYPDQILWVGSDPLIPDHPRPPYEIWQSPEGPQVLYVGVEFGTADVGDVFDLFRANTYIHTYGTPDDDFGRKVSAEYRELFYPAADSWRREILGKGLAILDRAVEISGEMDSVL